MTAGYSGTPLAKKIGIKPGHRVVLCHAPARWRIPDLPPDIVIATDDPAGADVVLAFYREHGDLAAEAPQLAAGLTPGAMLWIAWPRKAGGHVSDIAENDLRELLLPIGVVDVKVAALDNDWSGLKFVWRKRT
ncbi:DUF3052 domain-containing protein [Nocardia sp. NPDC004604]|uniref:DUF3052 domain-containing protein n=1 Tax=Nocardia sp. NPDC004604 TaxID=3157013 RepID=UPI0033B2BC1B